MQDQQDTQIALTTVDDMAAVVQLWQQKALMSIDELHSKGADAHTLLIEAHSQLMRLPFEPTYLVNKGAFNL